jgi:hypothetical protein
MSTQEKARTSGYKSRLSFNKNDDSIHVPESKLRAVLKSKSLREEQIEFLCELLSIESDRNKNRHECIDCDDIFMQGKIFC